jgi:hypothetical protein
LYPKKLPELPILIPPSIEEMIQNTKAAGLERNVAQLVNEQYIKKLLHMVDQPMVRALLMNPHCKLKEEQLLKKGSIVMNSLDFLLNEGFPTRSTTHDAGLDKAVPG